MSLRPKARSYAPHVHQNDPNRVSTHYVSVDNFYFWIGKEQFGNLNVDSMTAEFSERRRKLVDLLENTVSELHKAGAGFHYLDVTTEGKDAKICRFRLHLLSKERPDAKQLTQMDYAIIKNFKVKKIEPWYDIEYPRSTEHIRAYEAEFD